MIFKDFSDLLKTESSKNKDGSVQVAYIEQKIIKIRKRYNFDMRRLDLLIKPLFVQYNLFTEYALNDEISQILSAAKEIIQSYNIDAKKVKTLKNKIIDTYRKDPKVSYEQNLAIKGRWARIEGKISDLSNYPKIFSLIFGFNRVEFFAEKIVHDSNYMEQYLEIFLNYFNYEKFEDKNFDFNDCLVIEESLARLSYGNKVWIYEVFSPFIKTLFSVLDSITNAKELNNENLLKRQDLIIWSLLLEDDLSFIKEVMHWSVQNLLENSRINYRLKDYKFNKAFISKQIDYFSNVRKIRNNIEHTNPLFELLKNINDIKSINTDSPKLMSDINLTDYLPDKNMVNLRLESYIDGLDSGFDEVIGVVYCELMITLVDKLLGWYNPKRFDISEMMREKDGKNTKIA